MSSIAHSIDLLQVPVPDIPIAPHILTKLRHDRGACDTALLPEYDLAAAILHQAWKDLHAPSLQVRAEAVAFWQNMATLQWWEDLLGMEDALTRRATMLLAAEGMP
jgi:hypothetical protein